jgi:hypothetical protein
MLTLAASRADQLVRPAAAVHRGGAAGRGVAAESWLRRGILGDERRPRRDLANHEDGAALVLQAPTREWQLSVKR